MEYDTDYPDYLVQEALNEFVKNRPRGADRFIVQWDFKTKKWKMGYQKDEITDFIITKYLPIF